MSVDNGLSRTARATTGVVVCLFAAAWVSILPLDETASSASAARAAPRVERTIHGPEIAPSGVANFQPVDNGTVWRTSGGYEIRANGGSILKQSGVFFWYGMLYDGDVVDHVFHGTMKLMIYSSSDLSHWRFIRTVFSYDDEKPPADDPNVIWFGRPDVLYNAQTHTYVLSIERSVGSRNELAFYTATSPSGDFTWRADKEIKYPDGAHTMGDKAVFEDSDGRAYLLFVSDDGAPQQNNTNTKIAPFTPNYLGLTGVISSCGGAGHEALSVLKRQDSYYLFSSRTNGWRPSATTYKRASRLSAFPCTGGDDGGGWNLLPTTPTSADSFSTQHDFVLPVTGTDGVTYVYAGDRWWQFDPRIPGTDRYAWFPLTFDTRGHPLLHGYQHWSISAATGQWRPRA